MSVKGEHKAAALPGGVPRIARILTYAGLVPFLAGFVVALFGPPGGLSADLAMLAFKGYAAVILAFLGGVHWGMGLTLDSPDAQTRTLVISVLPPLIGAIALLAGPAAAFTIFAVAFLVQGLLDIVYFRRFRKGGWYARLRLEATAIVVVILALSAWFA